MLPERAFVLPSFVGWFANTVGLAYIILTTVLFLFPPELPATGSSMSKFNQTIVKGDINSGNRLLCGSDRDYSDHLNIPVDY